MAPRETEELCRAKLNLFLDVVGRRHDGYHELVTVFHEIDLADELVVRELADADEPRTVRVRVTPGAADASAVPADDANLAARAARLLLEHAGHEGSVELLLTKNVPTGAGLGGGSADAAATLRAVDRLFDLCTSEEDLERLAARIGSDVPFLLHGGTALGRGRGELLEPLPAAFGLRFLLLVPSFGVRTADVYRALPRDLRPPVSPAALRRALESGDVAALRDATHNALLDAALSVEPRLAQVLEHARHELGPGVQLTGSGSTLFLPVEDDALPDMGGWPFATRALLVT